MPAAPKIVRSLTARVAATTAGPSVSIAFVISAIACGLAAMCHAEFAPTVPVAGSAHTFSYATLGELIAWIIGWDPALELVVGACVVSKGQRSADRPGWSSGSGRSASAATCRSDL